MRDLTKKKIVKGYQRRFSHFNLAYKAALGAIALLCLVSVLLVDRASQPQLNDTSLIVAAESQRLYASRILYSVDELSEPSNSEAERRQNMESLARNLALWKAGRSHLLDAVASEGWTDVLPTIQHAGRIYAPIEEAGRRLLAESDRPRTDDDSLGDVMHRYLSAQERVVRQLLTHHREEIQGLVRLQFICAGLIVILLVVEGIWLFKPLLKGLRESFEQIDEHHTELEAIRIQLAAQNKSLRDNETSLNHALERAEDMSRLSRYSAARFEELFAGLPIAAFTFDEDGLIFEWNRESEALFHIKASRIVGRALDLAPSRPVLTEDYRSMVAAVFANENLRDLEQTVRLPSGETRLVLCNAFPLRGPEGRVSGGVCVMFDVTEASREAIRIAESETLFRTSMDSLQSGILFMDRNLCITRCNPRAAEILGLPISEVIGLRPATPRQSYFYEDGSPVEQGELPILQAFRTRKPVVDSILGILRGDGSEAWISVNASPVQLPGSDEPIGSVCSFTDITMFREQRQLLVEQMEKTNVQAASLEVRTRELEEANTKLAALATTDGLTKLNNHRHFQEAFEHAHALSQRSGRPLSLIMLDVDHFKRYNDVFGHPAGDEVLRGVAKALESAARDSDIVARYGGEEFVVLLPDTDEQGAMEAAERFRYVIEHHLWRHQPVTASFGVATTSQETSDREQLLELADAALYESKKRGRNCCTHAGSMRHVA